ncbi:hypothetical protein [Rhizobium alvei]|uniref:Uncharacterized protein n=1 Tax=Rhizobium alvei TaxID=1132659 RepID=A0ABT8YH61_9HYPH|nr:hypothetical protein [Rhizobium alvei]MDO6962916.1 hypothetical protein [Rhizobium alvei]
MAFLVIAESLSIPRSQISARRLRQANTVKTRAMQRMIGPNRYGGGIDNHQLEGMEGERENFMSTVRTIKMPTDEDFFWQLTEREAKQVAKLLEGDEFKSLPVAFRALVANFAASFRDSKKRQPRNTGYGAIKVAIERIRMTKQAQA